jgi:hypothetical protein
MLLQASVTWCSRLAEKKILIELWYMVQTWFRPELDLHWTEPLLNMVQVQVWSCWLKHVQFVFRFDKNLLEPDLNWTSATLLWKAWLTGIAFFGAVAE